MDNGLSPAGSLLGLLQQVEEHQTHCYSTGSEGELLLQGTSALSACAKRPIMMQHLPACNPDGMSSMFHASHQVTRWRSLMRGLTRHC
jgi:hypothetical protein